MNAPGDDFLEAAESGDPRAWLTHQTDAELRALMDYTEKLFRANHAKGGFPRDLLNLCCLEASERFRKQPPTP